ncbi:SGNH/GDSL hydrolase family protein [Mycobacterium sp. IDR2000157661]|uniref:SGNH/GDSL hydrolase family protein n=1 Tax=Mycobacterium sp. IDR2000157661 TaxID=2867005 RepID=UPI001EEC6AB1|nr:SGNH/GDSL hydrolase family protein [Mycobacterium sp. IDR2000157661]ULE33629.1 SGNH/GDSL hydrolase family protein [Mycobacterium sp. IDR2000157661]
MKRIRRTTVIGIAAVVALIGLGAGLAVGVNNKVANSVSAPPSTPASAEPTVLPVPVPKKVVLIGDYTAETNAGGSGPRNWTALVGLALQTNQPTQVVRDNAEGSGYVAAGAYNQTYLDAAKVLVKPDVSVVVIFGSRFDMYAAPDAVKNAALATYAAVREEAPDAVLLVVGPTWPGDQPPPALLNTRDMVRDAANEAGAVFVDPIEQGWFADDPGKLMAPDNIHPTDAGHERIALGIYQSTMEALERQS